MKVIGLTGFAGSGKSTVAQYLVEQHGFTRLSFAAPLKKMLRTLDPMLTYNPGDRYSPPSNIRLSRLTETLDWSEQQIKESDYGHEYRRLLQVLGTDCIRAVDPDFWVKAAVAQMDDPDGKYVFDDCRFPNEAEVISHYNLWGLWNVKRGGYSAINGHASEQHAGNMGEKQIIHNDTTVEALHGYIDLAIGWAFDEAAA